MTFKQDVVHSILILRNLDLAGALIGIACLANPMSIPACIQEVIPGGITASSTMMDDRL